MIKLAIEGRIPSKKNSKQIICRGKRPSLLPSKQHVEWHEDACQQIMMQTKEFGKTGIVIINMFPPDRRGGDLSNKAESIMDLLVDLNVIEDDNWFCVSGLLLFFGGIDKERPRAEIEIYEEGECIDLTRYMQYAV